MRLAAGQAVRRDVASASPGLQLVAYTPDAYLRDIARARLVLPLKATGDGLAAGALDLAWTVVSVPNDPAWTPRPAVVMGNNPESYQRAAPGLNWVSHRN